MSSAQACVNGFFFNWIEGEWCVSKSRIFELEFQLAIKILSSKFGINNLFLENDWRNVEYLQVRSTGTKIPMLRTKSVNILAAI